MLNVNELIENAGIAAVEFRKFNQEQTDKIVKKVYEAAFNNRIDLAKLAFKETHLGKWEDKVEKNIIASWSVYFDIINKKTVGVISEDNENGIVEIAESKGPIFAITPVTNPTSTVIFKILIAMKTRNPIIIRPHGAAKKCSNAAAKICYEAAIEAGAPKNCIQWIRRSTKEETLELMGHKKIALILATGSVSLVKSAYSSGNPAIGVGPGNVPVYIGKSCDVSFAVDQILLSKTFDNGTICASEQSVVVSKINSQQVIEEFKKRKAYFLSEEETALVEKIAFNKAQKVMSADVIGQSAFRIAEMANITVPEDTSVLIAPLKEVGIQSPISLEILAPILGFYVVENFDEAIEQCRKINEHGGLGHTVSIFSRDERKIEYFSEIMNAGRILVNTPSSQGALGGTFNSLQPSLTLACGSGGKNMTTDNISVQHLINIHRIARRQVNECYSCTKHFCMDESIDAAGFESLCEQKRNGER